MMKLAEIFQSNMTLQRGKEVNFYGNSEKEQKVTVYLDGIKIAEKQVGMGSYCISVPPQETLIDAEIKIQYDGGEILLENVDFGEVYIAGGQSNMEFLLKYDKTYRKEGIKAPDNHLRYFNVEHYCFEGQEAEGLPTDDGVWREFNEKDAYLYSAVGYYFAAALREVNPTVPVAIVGCNWGGTKACAWTKRECLEKDEVLRCFIEEYEEGIKELNLVEYEAVSKELRKNSALSKNGISDAIMYGDVDMGEMMKELAKQMQDPKAMSAMKYMQVIGTQSPNRPASLYDYMLKKVIGFSCRGIIWYQGESDDYKAEIYDKSFAMMIKCWRDAWKEELPFLFVQLAPFGSWMQSTGENFPLLRKKQQEVADRVKGVYMASIMDVGMELDIHPKDKKPVGERLALLARKYIYGEDVLCESPRGVKLGKKDECLEITFDHAEGGLKIDGDKLNALEIYVDGEKAENFSAKTKGDKLIVCGLKLKENSKARVEFASTGYCVVNLYNGGKLAARPFVLEA